jgi:hypothetical protein
MKRILPALVAVLMIPAIINAQIITPIIKANFGVDADLRANFFNGFTSAGNDDWFNNGTAGMGAFIIDTTGAAGILSRYVSQPSTRMQPFFRGMRYPQFSVVNNRLLLDAIFIRDHHGDDSTVFAAGSNKNGMSPNLWTTPISQGIPDKNDILDMFMHVRRDGPNNTDSLWFFGGLSLANTTGNRYFDFEMYQTDILYYRPSLSFIGYGPDAGHTSWKFDAAGNVTQVGDIIFTAEYGSSSLSFIEARIWIHQSSLGITPANFNWSGQFDGGGPGATYGYASITPKTAGNYYTGLQSVNNTWAGPFQVVLQDNSLQVNYSARQFMEFSVNLSKLGLDPLHTVNDACAMPFRKLLVKSRASTSFTAELKDFVGPFSFFRIPDISLATNFPNLCLPGVADIWINNGLPTSLFTWRTTNGNIVGDTVGTSIQVDQPGTYIVSQQLMDSCGSTWATDTILINMGNGCVVLNSGIKNFNALRVNEGNFISWNTDTYIAGERFEVQRSANGVNYTSIASREAIQTHQYSWTDYSPDIQQQVLWYRIKMTSTGGRITYSTVQRILTGNIPDIRLGPVPTGNSLNIIFPQGSSKTAEVIVMNNNGIVVKKQTLNLASNFVSIELPSTWANGSYVVSVKQDDVINRKRILLQR